MMTESDRELLVISDTHGDMPVISLIFRWAKKRGVGSLAFLGDGFSDILRAFDKTGYTPVWRAVRGNGDPDADLPFERTFDVAGRRFLLTHGHLNGVQDTLDSLVFAARSAKAEAALFGHTHCPFTAVVRGLALINPGSPSRPRCESEASFATVPCGSDGPLSALYWKIGADGSIGAYDLNAPKTNVRIEL